MIFLHTVRRHAFTIFHITAPIETNKASSIFIKNTKHTKRIILLFKNMHPILNFILSVDISCNMLSSTYKYILCVCLCTQYLYLQWKIFSSGTLEVHRRNLFRVYNLFLHDNEIIYAKENIENCYIFPEKGKLNFLIIKIFFHECIMLQTNMPPNVYVYLLIYAGLGLGVYEM